MLDLYAEDCLAGAESLSSEPQKKLAKHTGLIIMVVIFVLPASYLLSFAPLYFIAFAPDCMKPDHFLSTFYKPLLWLCHNSETFYNYNDKYYNLIMLMVYGVKNDDSN